MLLMAGRQPAQGQRRCVVVENLWKCSRCVEELTYSRGLQKVELLFRNPRTVPSPGDQGPAQQETHWSSSVNYTHVCDDQGFQMTLFLSNTRSVWASCSQIAVWGEGYKYLLDDGI